jgi:hypothetical protein
MNVYGYAWTDLGEDDQAVFDQLDMIHDYCDQNDLTLARNFVDANVPVPKPWRSDCDNFQHRLPLRAQLTKLLGTARQGDVIVVCTMRAWAGNAILFGKHSHDLYQLRGVRTVALDMPECGLEANPEICYAWLRDFSRRIRTQQQRPGLRSRHRVATPPIGFRWEIIPDEYEREIMRLLLKLHRYKPTWYTIWRSLKSRRIVNPRTSEDFTIESIQNWLNIAYILEGEHDRDRTAVASERESCVAQLEGEDAAVEVWPKVPGSSDLDHQGDAAAEADWESECTD